MLENTSHRRITGFLPLLVACSGLLFQRSSQEVDLTSQQVSEDLDQFQLALEERGAYSRVGDPDYESALQKIRDQAESGMAVNVFARELQKVIGLFVDSHSRVQPVSFPPGYLPFHVEHLDGRYLAIKPDRSGFVSDSHPYLVAIDGVGFEEWVLEAGEHVARGSAQLVMDRSLMYLANIQFFRDELGVDASDSLGVELQSEDRSETRLVWLDVQQQPARHRQWPERQSEILAGNIGYLRIGGWSQGAFAEISTWMPQFEETNGLIIDVRDNRGGTRAVLLDLYPYFVKDTDEPIVANPVRYRLFREYGPDHLSAKNMHPQDWEGWTEQERQAIAEFMEEFRPEWNPPEDEFSDWHFWMLSKKTNVQAYDYAKPVIFLMNEKGFSATDVVLAAVKGIPNVTLLGMPTGGGSGHALGSRLEHSGLMFVLSSMASFQKDGSLIDGRGVQPDIYLEPVPEYYLNDGRDVVLERALALIAQ